MSFRTYSNESMPPLPAATAIPVFSLVKVSSGTYAIAGASDVAVGVVMRAVASGEIVQPRPHLAGSLVCIASAAIAADTVVVQDASGKIKALPTSGGGTAHQVGRTLADTAGADGDWIEVHPIGFSTVLTVAP